MTASFIDKLTNAKKISFFDKSNLSNMMLDFLATCKDLEFLEISNTKNFDGKKAAAALHNIKNLKFIYLRDCEALTDEVVSAIPQGCLVIDLSIFDITKKDQLTDEGLAKLLNACTSLEVIHLFGRRHLSDAVFFSFPPSTYSITMPGKAGYKLTQKFLFNLFQKCPDLQSLKMGCSPFVVDRLPPFQKLQLLDLNFCKISPDLTLPKMESLTSLYLKSVGPLSDQFIMNLTKMCPNLKNLFLSFNDISDRQVQILIENLPFLSTLDLSRSEKITDMSLKIISRSKRIKQLNILGCRISPLSIATLSQKRPQIEILS